MLKIGREVIFIQKWIIVTNFLLFVINDCEMPLFHYKIITPGSQSQIIDQTTNQR